MLEGIVQNGVVVFAPGAVLPEGTHVRVEPVALREPPTEQGGANLQWLLDMAGIANDLPTDMARNHDHYLHGAPKK